MIHPTPPPKPAPMPSPVQPVLDPIPPPLRDRMEVLEIAGYTEEEKLKIATDHLVDKQVRNHGLSADYITFTSSSTVRNFFTSLGGQLPDTARLASIDSALAHLDTLEGAVSAPERAR